MNHGEAVAVGTALIAGAAVKLGALTQADCDRIVNVLTALGFDLTPPVEVKRLLKEVGKDKKNEDGMLRIVLPVGIGDCEVRPMTMDACAGRCFQAGSGAFGTERVGCAGVRYKKNPVESFDRILLIPDSVSADSRRGPASQSVIVLRATPDSIAALATATEMVRTAAAGRGPWGSGIRVRTKYCCRCRRPLRCRAPAPWSMRPAPARRRSSSPR